jgi:uncharacterized protein
MTPHEFSIPVHDLDAAGKAFAFPVRAAWLRATLADGDAAPAGPDGALEVRVSKSGNDVVVHGRLKAEIVVPCARCLEPAKVAIDGPVSVLMVPASAMKTPEDEEYEFSPDEADVMPYHGDEVVLDDLVRDEILLEIPMIPLCSEECPGMSGPPAVDGEPKGEHVDPRLLPLLELKKKSANKKE